MTVERIDRVATKPPETIIRVESLLKPTYDNLKSSFEYFSRDCLDVFATKNKSGEVVIPIPSLSGHHRVNHFFHSQTYLGLSEISSETMDVYRNSTTFFLPRLMQCSMINEHKVNGHPIERAGRTTSVFNEAAGTVIYPGIDYSYIYPRVDTYKPLYMISATLHDIVSAKNAPKMLKASADTVKNSFDQYLIQLNKFY